MGTVLRSIKEVKAPIIFDGYHGIALHVTQGIGPHLAASGKSHGFSRVALGTWDVFVRAGGDGASKSCMFSDIRTPVYLKGTAWDSPRGMEVKEGPLSGGVGGPRPHCNCSRDIGIPIHF